MTVMSNTVPTKVSVTAQELEATLHKALRTHPECKDIKLQKLRRLENSQGLANWDAEFSTQPGAAISQDCRRVLIGVKQGLQKHFDLVGTG
jgi:hypothetical protein